MRSICCHKKLWEKRHNYYKLARSGRKTKDTCSRRTPLGESKQQIMHQKQAVKKNLRQEGRAGESITPRAVRGRQCYYAWRRKSEHHQKTGSFELEERRTCPAPLGTKNGSTFMESSAKMHHHSSLFCISGSFSLWIWVINQSCNVWDACLLLKMMNLRVILLPSQMDYFNHLSIQGVGMKNNQRHKCFHWKNAV